MPGPRWKPAEKKSLRRQFRETGDLDEVVIEGRSPQAIRSQAVRLGLVNTVLEGDDEASFLDAVLTYAKQFTCPNTAAMAVGHIKRSCQSGAEVPLEQGLALERELQAKLFASADAKKPIAATVQQAEYVWMHDSWLNETLKGAPHVTRMPAPGCCSRARRSIGHERQHDVRRRR